MHQNVFLCLINSLACLVLYTSQSYCVRDCEWYCTLSSGLESALQFEYDIARHDVVT